MGERILVIGATGAMGRAVARALLGSTSAHTVRVLTRDPSSPQAKSLLADDVGRVEIAQGNVDDESSLRAALTGAEGLFINTDFFSSLSVQSEYKQGLRVLETARAAGVGRVVYSSLDAAVSLTDGRIPVPHYDAKAGVEHWIDLQRADEFMRRESAGWYSSRVSVLVTAPYYENFQSLFPPQPGKLRDGRDGLIFHFAGGGHPHPMIALEDIGWFARELLENPGTWGGRTLRVVGDMPTLDEVARTFELVTGIACEWQDLPLATVEAFPNFGHDLAQMYRLFQDHGIVRDRKMLRRLHPRLLDFEAWLRKTGWRGERLDVQKAQLT